MGTVFPRIYLLILNDLCRLKEYAREMGEVGLVSGNKKEYGCLIKL